MKYKVGDKVRIKTNGYDTKFIDKLGKTKIIHLEFLPEMKIYCGYIAIIIEVKQDMNLYRIDLDNHRFMWCDEMFDETFDFKQLAIGEVFDFEGHKLKVEKDINNSCNGCIFDKCKFHNGCICDILLNKGVIPECTLINRVDKNSIIFKEIKDSKTMEERTIKVDIDTARKWYNGSDDSLRTLALQAFSEYELKDSVLPNTWNEFCLETPIKQFEYYISADSGISQRADGVIRRIECDKNVLPNKKSAEGHLAAMQLEQLRNRYRQGWKPNWKDSGNKYVIEYDDDNLSSDNYKHCNRFLSFQSREIRDLFVKNFKDLIELAKEYI